MRRFVGLPAIFLVVASLAGVPSQAIAFPDATADRELGQVGFSYGTSNLIDGKGFRFPEGVALDTSTVPNRVYVVDSQHSRVLAWADSSAYANGAPADLVIGQPDPFTTRLCDIENATNLCFPSAVAVDAAGNVYVADSSNSRVLAYLTPFTTDTTADVVFGQGGNFESNECNLGGISASSLCVPDGVAVDSAGNLYVSDGNSRVLVYETPLTTDTMADVVFGQGGSFTSGACNQGGLSATSLCLPHGLVVDSGGNVYVADYGNNRVLVYDTPLTTDTTADHVFGQGASFESNECNLGGVSATSLCGPAAVATDGAGNLYVSDYLNSRVLGYATPLTTDTTADEVFGQSGSFAIGSICNVSDGASATSLCGPDGVAVDGAGNLYVSDINNNRVLAYDKPFMNDTAADRVLGQAGFSYDTPDLIDGAGLAAPLGVAIDKSTVPNRAYVADTDNSRVVAWADVSAYVNGAPADLVIGQPDAFTSGCDSVTSATSLCSPSDVAVDGAGNLYVVDSSNSRVLAYMAPFSTDTTADLVFGQSGSFTSSTCNLGGVSATSLCYPSKVAVDGTGNVYVADSTNNRVLAYTAPLSTDTTADVVFGQGGNFTSSDCNVGGVTANALCGPEGLAIDAATNVYVADRYNHRVLAYAAPLSTDTTADAVLGQDGSFESSTCNLFGVSATGLCVPKGLAIDAAANVYVADEFNNRVLAYASPLTTDTTADAVFGQGGSFTSSTCNLGGVSATSLCSPNGVAVDGAGNVYVADWSNSRVLEFWQTGFVCGDGLVDTGEQCDDGGVAPGDGCDASCAVEPCYVCNGAPSVCTKPDADEDTLGDLCDSCPADAANTCNTSQSAVGSVGSGGGTVTTPDGSVDIDIPAGALPGNTPISITGGLADSNFGVDRNGRDALLVNIGPNGTTFDAPVTITLSWPDANDDGKVDGFTSPILREGKLQVWKDGIAITQTTGNPASALCEDPSHMAPACNTACGGLKCCCDEAANTWTVQVTSLSEFFVGTPFAQIPVTPLKLVVVDKTALTSKTVFVAKDLEVTTGTGTDVGDISVRLDLAYANAQAAGSFLLDAGPSWLVNKPTVAKYVNNAAPAGPTQAKVGVVKPGSLLKLVGRGLGDVAFDVLGAGDPAGSVYAAYCVANGGSEYCHCAEFTSCSYKPIAADTGAKLVCKGGLPDPGCVATAP